MFEKQKNTRDEDTTANNQGSVSSNPVSSSAPSPSKSTAVIGRTIVIKGDISGDEDLVVEGKIEGNVNLHAHELSVGKSGVVTADINAKAVRIEGEVQGDIVGNDVVTIAKSGNVRGNIVSPRMTLEDGAKFKGSIDMDPGEAASASASYKAPDKAQRVVSDQSTREPSVNQKNG